VSDENVDVLRRVIDAFNRRDEEAALALADPAVELESALVEKQVFRGHQGLRQYRQNLDEAWSEWHTANDELIEAEGDRVLHLYRIVGKGKGSGVAIEADIAMLWTIREGRLLRGKVFLDQAEARAAAGLQAQA
jgi:ketosteroid isomerase-like protein